MTNKTNDVEGIIRRLLGLGIPTQVELAQILGVKPAAITAAKARKRFPLKWISILCKLYGVSSEWLLGLESKAAETQQTTDKDEIIISLLDEKCKRLEEDNEKIKQENYTLRDKLKEQEKETEIYKDAFNDLEKKKKEDKKTPVESPSQPIPAPFFP